MNENMTWDPSLSVDNAHIDRQHEEIIRIFGQLKRHRPQGGDSQQRLQTLISNLIIIMTKHFFDEEELMMRHGCPSYAEHARNHAYFIERLSQALQMDEQQIMQQGIPALAELMMEHLTHEDIPARAYLAAGDEAVAD